MNVNKLAPIAKAVVATIGSVITILAALSAVVALFSDGVLSPEEMNVLYSNVVVILAAIGIPVAVYQVPNKKVL